MLEQVSKENEGVSHFKQREEQVKMSYNLSDMFKGTVWIPVSLEPSESGKQQEMMGVNQMLYLLDYCYESFILNERESHSRVLNSKVTWGDFVIPVTVIVSLGCCVEYKPGYEKGIEWDGKGESSENSYEAIEII